MEKEQSNLPEEQERIDLTRALDDVWSGVKKFWWIFLAVISLCASFSYFTAVRRYAPVYEAYSTFVVNTRTAYGYSETFYNQTAATQLSRTFPYILTSGALNQVVAKSLGLESVPASIRAEAMEDTALFTIRVTAGDAQMAYDVLQAVITNYPTVAEYIIGDTQLTLMDESGVPETPNNPPDFRNNAVKGAAVGGVLCILFLVLYAMTRNMVRGEADLKARLSVPYLGSLPQVKLKKRSDKSQNQILIDSKNSGSMLGESIRSIRNRVMKEAEKHGDKSLLVTSAAAGEGKTTFCVNLAISLAKKGKRVILVDGDLRNPSIAKAMGLSDNVFGEGDILYSSPLKAWQLWDYGELSLKVCRRIKRRRRKGTDGLRQEEIEYLIAELEGQCDYLIVDTPPCGILSDASLFARCVDGAIMVVRQDYTRIDQILSAVELLADTGVHLLGYAINGTKAGITGYGYGYGYGYGRGYGSHKYGYGYIYGQKEKKEEKDTARSVE